MIAFVLDTTVLLCTRRTAGPDIWFHSLMINIDIDGIDGEFIFSSSETAYDDFNGDKTFDIIEKAIN